MHHLLKGGALLGVGAGYSFVGINFIQFPLRMMGDVLIKIPPLTFKGVGLILFVGRYAAVGGNFRGGFTPYL
jgi:hypothetical protein